MLIGHGLVVMSTDRERMRVLELTQDGLRQLRGDTGLRAALRTLGAFDLSTFDEEKGSHE